MAPAMLLGRNAFGPLMLDPFDRLLRARADRNADDHFVVDHDAPHARLGRRRRIAGKAEQRRKQSEEGKQVHAGKTITFKSV